MNCHEARQSLANKIRSGDSINSDSELVMHLESCELCQHNYADLRLEHSLQQLEVPAPRSNFVEQVIASAITENRPTISRPRVYAGAVAATLIFGLTLSFIYKPIEETETNLEITHHAVQMEVNRTKNINVVIESDSYRAETTITVSLAENMQLQGYENTSELTWQTELLRGKNVLTLPLIMHDAAGGYINISYQSGADVGAVRVAVSET